MSFRVDGFQINKKIKSLKEIRKSHVVTQSLDFSCGAAGLATIFNYYHNDPISEKEIIISILNLVDLELVKKRKGFSLLDLKKFSESRGYKATGYKMDFEFLAELNRPTLVPIKFKNYRHFVIVKAVVGDRVFITDPSLGNLTMKITKFERIWINGIGLVIEHPGSMENKNYALTIKKEDALFADYKNLLRTMEQATIRTAIFPHEY